MSNYHTGSEEVTIMLGWLSCSEMSQSTLPPGPPSLLSRQSSLILYNKSVPLQHSPKVRSTDLPSTSYQFSRWFELDTKELSSTNKADCQFRGSALHSPRVREGPPNVTSLCASHSVMYCKRSQDWKDFRNSSEDWEHTEAINLSYQDLGDDYQLRNFHRCLNRLVACKHLQLIDNSLSSIKKATLPSCIHLNVSRNYFTSFDSFPKAPNLEHLSAADNNIASTATLPSLAKQYPHLKTLILTGNPVAATPDYRHSVFQILPILELLDGYPALSSDQDCLNYLDKYYSSPHMSTNFDKCTLC